MCILMAILSCAYAFKFMKLLFNFKLEESKQHVSDDDYYTDSHTTKKYHNYWKLSVSDYFIGLFTLVAILMLIYLVKTCIDKYITRKPRYVGLSEFEPITEKII